MDVYIMETKKYMDIGYAPLGKAKLIHVENLKEAKQAALRFQVYALSRVFIGEAITDKGFIDTTKPFIFYDGNRWRKG